MNKTILLNCILLFVLTIYTHAQRMSRSDYIKKYKHIAINNMIEHKIPASITLAQGILESGSGNSKLARRANNHFGIKCHKDWNGRSFRYDDDERRECFRKYKNPEESFKDHSLFLSKRERYAELFKLEITDYKAWAKGLKKAGYATNPKYPKLLIKIIEENKLDSYDLQAIAMMKGKRPVVKSKKFYIVSRDDFKHVEIAGNNRKIYENNKRKFIIARNGDSFRSLADEFNIYSWQIYKYNDLDKDDKIREGQMLYLERKKGKGSKKYHFVEENESMYTISQRFGIRLKRLYRRNDMEEGTEPAIGERLRLR